MNSMPFELSMFQKSYNSKFEEMRVFLANTDSKRNFKDTRNRLEKKCMALYEERTVEK